MMWPPQPTLWLKNLTLLLILTSTPHIFAQPTDRRPALPPNERGLSNLLGGSALGNLTDDIGDLIQDATSLLTTFIGAVQAFNNATNENDLLELLGVGLKGNTEDDEDSVTNSTISAAGPNSTCPGMAVLFARGTAEPGNVGLFTGPSLSTALRNYINGTTTLAIQGIPYAASIPGFLAGGSPFGAGAMALLANETATACPKTKLVLAGYSQGAQVVHGAMELINKANNTAAGAGRIAFSPDVVNPRITSILLFGDPRNGTAIPGVDNAQRVLSVCHAQDDICAHGGDVITLDHLTYSQNAAQAAMFAMQRSGLGVASRDAMGQGMGNVPVVQSAGKVDGGTKVGSGSGLPGFGLLGGR